MTARFDDAANRSSSLSKNLGLSVTAGNLAANAFSNVASAAKDFAVEGVKMNASLDKLVRFTSTLDKNFQNPVALQRFTNEIKQLATEIPQSAEDIAKASFTIKSAFGNLNEKQTIDYLKQFGLAATASNTNIATHAENVAALAKAYKIPSDQLQRFNALIASSFGQALAEDSQVAQGFNRVLNGAVSVKQPLETVIAAMSTLQGASNDAAQNTTLLGNVFAKMTDAKYQEGFDEISSSVYDAKGNFRDLKDILADVEKQIAGMSDKQINEKLGFLKDKEAREGFLTLLKNKKAFDEQLANGAGIEAFQQKTNVMLDATESRWSKFYANITNLQSGAGGKISDFFLEAFDSTSVVGGVRIFFLNIANAAAQGILYLAESIMSPINKISEVFNTALFGDEVAQKAKANTNKFFEETRNLISESIADNTRMILQNQKDSWQKIADSIADPESKAKALKNVESLTKAIQGNINKSSVELYQSYKELSESTISGLSSNDEKLKAQGTQTAQILVNAINEALKNPNLDQGIANEFRALLEELKKAAQQYGVTLQNVAFRLGSNIGNGLAGGLNSQRGAVVSAAANLMNAASMSANSTTVSFRTGSNIGQGFVNGIKSQTRNVTVAAVSLADAAIFGAENKLEIASPSKRFYKIGQQTFQGFIDGIRSLKAAGQEALASILDVSGLKLGKKDVAGAELWKSYVDEIKNLNIVTKEQAAIAELALLKYDKLDAKLKASIITAAKAIDAADKLKDSYSKIGEVFTRLTEATSKPQTELEKVNALFANPANAEAIAKYAAALKLTVGQFQALSQIKASIADRKDSEPEGLGTGRTNDGVGEGFGNGQTVKTLEELGAPPPLKKSWDDFFGTFFQRIEQMKSSLPSVRVAIGENLVSAISGIGDVFSRALLDWSSGSEGFFKSLANGFKSLISQIISELIRLMVMQAVLKIIGAFAGGGGGDGGKLPSFDSTFGKLPGRASGGLIQGKGTGTSDSILARLSNGEFVNTAATVKHYGAGFFTALNQRIIPKEFFTPPAFANGGLVSPAMVAPVSNYSSAPQNATHNYNLPPITINGAKDPVATGQSVKQAMREMIGKMQHEQQRNK